MACNILVNRPIFIVHPLSRIKEENNHYYIFVGIQNNEIMEILEKLINEKTIKKKNLDKLKEVFGETVDFLLKLIKNIDKLKLQLHLIPDFIKMDDSLNEVKKKIFVYCSQINKNKYILPRNQEIWIQTNGVKKLLGYHYIKKNSDEIYEYPPHTDVSYNVDNKLLKYNQRMNIIEDGYRVDTSENYLLLYDIFEGMNIENNVIYVSDALDEIKYLKSKKILMNEKKNKSSFERILNGYLKKYWIHIHHDIDIEEVKILYKQKLQEIERDQYILKLMTEEVVDSSMFEDCSMKTVKFNINSKNNFDDENEIQTRNNLLEDENDNQNENNINIIDFEKESDFVDLYQLFDYIREKKININTPFVRYGDVTIDDPFIIISLQSIQEKKLTKNILYEWLNLLKQEDRKFNGLQLKRYIKDYGEEPKYSSVNISRNGKITISISYKQENHASIQDIELAVKNCKKLIDELNQHIPDYRLIRSVSENRRIQSPDMTIHENGLITFKKNTKMTFLNMTIGMNLPQQLDFKKLMEYSKRFPSFISQEPSFKKKSDESIQNSLKIRYNRVSSFANMNDIMIHIDKMVQKNMSDKMILDILMKTYQMTLDESKRYLLTWKKQFSILGKGKIDSQYKIGVRVQIFQKKIILDGITNVYQISELYRFFTFFVYSFLKRDELKTKNREYRKYFESMNLQFSTMNNFVRKENNTEPNQEFNFLANYNKNMYIKELQGLNEFMINKEYENVKNKGVYKEMMNFDVNEVLGEGNIKNKVEQHISERGTLLAKENDLDVNIRLDCGDDKEIEEVQTCEDFCNDEHYFIRRLQLYDNVLFKYSVVKGKGEKQYSRCCQRAEQQPVVLDYDPISNPRIKKDSYSYTYQYSSDPELNKRWYICPKIWCPYCEIPISENDVDKRTIHKKLMKGESKFCVTCQCPYGDHQAFIRDEKAMTFEEEKKFKNELKKIKSNKERNKLIKDRENKSEFYAYPTFAAQKNPKGFCLPCCSKKPHNIPESGKYESYMRCLGEEISNDNKDDGQIYIKKSIPVDKNRFGILPIQAARVLNSIVEPGVLGIKSGYFRKGIKQNENTSFLYAISDIISCDKTSQQMPIEKLQRILVEKLEEKIFKSLYGGNLEKVFLDKTKNTTPYENFKYFLQQNDQEVNHVYLWDYLQRQNILYNEGVNIFIFDDNVLLCPKGENMKEFYDKSRKNVILVKHKNLYEPVYYLDGDGKGARMKCIFDSTRPEMTKLHQIVENGCNEKQVISWEDVLQDSIKKYQLNIQLISIDMGLSLMNTLEKLLLAIKDGKLKNTFMPIKQFVDGYNKVFGIGLRNGLFLPVKPSKLYIDLPYEELIDMDSITYLTYDITKNLLRDISEKTGIQCKVVEKIVDKTEGRGRGDILAVILENDRIVPVVRGRDRDNKIRVSDRRYYSNVDYYINKSVDYIPDNRVELINKKNYEDESYQRLRFEISRFIQLKSERDMKNKIMEVINMEGKTLMEKRRKLFGIIQQLMRDIVVIGDREFPYASYVKPNKRVPCFQRGIQLKKENNNSNIEELSCRDDPHCIVENGKCKLFIQRKNLLDKKRDNEIFYIDRIVEELLRYPLKRNEIIYDNISSVIDKELIVIDPKKYVLLHGERPVEMLQILENLYLDRRGIQMDKRITVDEFVTEEFTFMKDRYIKTNTKVVNDSLLGDLPTSWEPYLDSSFKIQKNVENSLFISLSYALRELPTNGGITVRDIQMKIAETLENIKDDRNIIKSFYYIMNPYCEDNPYRSKNVKNGNNNNINNKLMIEDKKKKVKDDKKRREEKVEKMNNKMMEQRKMNMIFDENTLVSLYKNQCRKLLSHVQSFDGLIHEITSDRHIGCEMDIITTSYMMNVNIIILEKFKHKEEPKFYCIGKQFDSGLSKYIILFKTLAFDKNIYFIVESKGKYLFEDIDLPFEFRDKIVEKCSKHETLDFEC